MAEFRWKRGADDFAIRVDLETVKGVFQKGVVVEPGCKALLIIDGALAAELGPGEYNEGGIVARLRNLDLTRFATAIIVDAGDVTLAFDLPGLMTKDPMQIDVDCSLVVQIDNPVFFYTNVMKGRTVLSRREVETLLAVEIHNALYEAISRRSVEELNTDLSLKQQFEAAVEEHLKRTFARTGFGFVHFRTIDYCYRGFDKIRGIREDVFLQVSEQEAQLDGRKRLHDVYDRDELQRIFEDTRKLERAVIEQRERARVIRELNPLVMDEHKTVEQMEQFLQEERKRKTLRDQELRDYVRVLKENEDDALVARDFLVRRVQLQQEIEYETMRGVGRADVERQVAEAQGKARLAQLDAQISEDKAKRLHQRAQDTEDHLHELQKLEQSTETKSRIQKLRIQVYETWKLTKLALKDKGTREAMARKLWYVAEKLELRLKVGDQKHRQELEKLQALTSASIEAILATTDEKQAKIIAGLKKQEALKDMSEEQLRWMAAMRQPALVSALEKMYEGAAKQEIEAIYQQWMTDKDQARADVVKMMEKALETQRDTAVAAAGAQRPTVVTGGGMFGTTVVGPGAGGTGTILCSRCRTPLQPDAKYCSQCSQPVTGIAPPPSAGSA